MKISAARFAAGIGLFAAGAPFPACGQFAYPPIYIVPPPTEQYVAPKPLPKAQAPKPKPDDSTAQAKPAGHYEGRTFVPD